MSYGEGFADFLAGFAPAAELPYLSAVACLDRCWTECHLAADATAVDRQWLAQQTPDTLYQASLQPHPAARWAWCDEHPAYALWQSHREGLHPNEALEWTGDGALLTRPHAEVVWHPLSRAGTAFLDACAKGHTLEAAATSALNAEPTADFAALISTLLDAGALIPTD